MKHPTATPRPSEPLSLPPACGKRGNVFTAAFTLVELLAVIAVMVMLLAFTLPLMRGGSSITKAGWDIAGVIEQARAYAQSQNTYVWLAFHEGSTSGSNRVSVFALASLDGTSSTTPNPGNTTNIAAIDKVRFFENVSFAQSNTHATHFATYAGSPGGTGVTENNLATGSSTGLLAVDMPKNSGNASAKFPLGELKMLLIDPSGSISMPGSSTAANYFDIRLVPMRGASVALANTNAPEDSVILRIQSLGGRVKVIRYAVTETPEEP